MNRRKFIAGAGAGVVTMAALQVAEGVQKDDDEFTVSFKCKACGSDMVITRASTETKPNDTQAWVRLRVTCKSNNWHWKLYRLPVREEHDVLHKDGSN